ncbi:MAG: hypothetical protein A3E78_01410 [Alphaproteobacteria bacterium RIFCSPHIGHO2_12_FULL_63_12]|nr:MAG: hypothetical protein A3E78_01410 [Alphaproteobacteria bacterium RIFCSPHIGHO2_12_FULL_63_12]
MPCAPPRLTREAFVVSASNERALKALDAWRLTAENLLVICGPKGSGKTHLTGILQRDLGEVSVHDDMPAGLSPAELLRLIEKAREQGGRMVLAGRGDPREWAAGLKDLETRLNAAVRITLLEPDEALLRAVILKVFTDRQLRAPETIADYAAPRLPKTFAAAQAFVAALDALSIEKGQPIGLKLARQAVANLSEAAFEA